MNFSELSIKLRTMVIFRQLMKNRVMAAFDRFLHTENETVERQVDAYCDFVSVLYEYDDNFTRYILEAAVNDENAYIKKVALGDSVSELVEEYLKTELEILSEIASTTSQQLCSKINYSGVLPAYYTENIDFASEYRSKIAQVKKRGYGIYANNVMFRYCDGGIVPVLSADKIEIGSLIGYELERKAVIDNTRAFVRELPAANMLLCGDAGTGKSSTVKAVANLFASEGLRLLELRKEQLMLLPAIIEQLRTNPLKFIVFVDDLSFQKNDDNFSALKAILEGSVSARPKNVLIYATSNRRHLVKETFSDREGGDDIHRQDTVQELLSLSERFGITVLFSKPNKALYLDIVHSLAKRKGIEISEELDKRAEAFALRKGTRSARAAEQFTDILAAEHNLTGETDRK